MDRLVISLFGPLQAKLRTENIIPTFRTKKERALFAYLVAESSPQHHRDFLGELLWPDRAEGLARTNLRQALLGIRRALQGGHNPVNFLTISDDYVRFNKEHKFFLDADEFDNLIQETNIHHHESLETCAFCAEKLETAVNLYQGDFLEDLSIPDAYSFQEWILIRREYYFRKMLMAIQTLVDFYIGQGKFKTAQKYAWQQVSVAPLEERAHCQLMKILVIDGQRGAALEQYQVCRQILATQLGVDPDITTTALYEKIKAGLTIDPPRVITQPLRTNLPAQFTSFVGRENELSWFEGCISNQVVRLITITGMSGVGKTRMAIQMGYKYLRHFADGVWFVPLEGVHTLDLLAPSIAKSLELKLDGQNPTQVLIDHLRTKTTLLIVDNFEHLLDGSQLLLEILHKAPYLKILVTSQRRLSYQAAYNLDLRGLPYPQDIPHTPNIQDYAAVKLFLARGNRVYSGYQPEDTDLPYIAKICQLVDGLPLAIELAAANLRHRTCEQIASELQTNLGSLAASMEDIPERHRSIRATFDQSWTMLSEEEQDAYQRLSIFQGEFSLDVANRTTGATFAVISSLADKSLIQTNASGHYILQPLLRQYASEKLVDNIDSHPQQIKTQTYRSTSLTHDPQTNLPNQILFRDLCNHAIARARRSKLHVIIIVLNVEDILESEINRSMNEQRYLIHALAGYFTSQIRESDTLARISNNRFAILLDDVQNPEAGIVVINKILGTENRKLPETIQGFNLSTLVKYGISSFPEDGELTNSLIEAASS
ncbi:MAG TPA: hypothetical protein DEH25_17100 [Chloroflexi bacterium]|nr:hypothetical protein [Chloroflexota bacterium]HBY09356.1 hypothetical protein [Chloroflexota bacterium]